MVSHHIRAIHHLVSGKLKEKLPPKEHVHHWIKTAIRLTLVITAIHFGIKGLEHWGVFLKFGKTSEFVTGSVVDYMFVSTLEAS